MKKFFCVIPFTQPAAELKYQAVDNSLLTIDTPIAFPILAAINGSLNAEEDSELVCLATVGSERYLTEIHMEHLTDQLMAITGRNDLKMPSIKRIDISNSENIKEQLHTFLEVIESIDESDELYADITFGTKPTAFTLLSAVQNAYKIKRNTSLRCICYGKYDRVTGVAKLYDLTALVRMDHIVSSISGSGDPEAAIRAMLEY